MRTLPNTVSPTDQRLALLSFHGKTVQEYEMELEQLCSDVLSVPHSAWRRSASAQRRVPKASRQRALRTITASGEKHRKARSRKD